MGAWTKISSIPSTNIKYNKDCKHIANIEKTNGLSSIISNSRKVLGRVRGLQAALGGPRDINLNTGPKEWGFNAPRRAFWCGLRLCKGGSWNWEIPYTAKSLERSSRKTLLVACSLKGFWFWNKNQINEQQQKFFRENENPILKPSQSIESSFMGS